jgi:hypothetical protein
VRQCAKRYPSPTLSRTRPSQSICWPGGGGGARGGPGGCVGVRGRAELDLDDVFIDGKGPEQRTVLRESKLREIPHDSSELRSPPALPLPSPPPLSYFLHCLYLLINTYLIYISVYLSLPVVLASPLRRHGPAAVQGEGCRAGPAEPPIPVVTRKCDAEITVKQCNLRKPEPDYASPVAMVRGPAWVLSGLVRPAADPCGVGWHSKQGKLIRAM